jgi:hypothetical protein
MHCHRLFICLALAASPALLGSATPAGAADEVAREGNFVAGRSENTILRHQLVDPVIGTYILGDRTNKAVDVIDTATNSVLTQLMGGFVGPSTSNDTAGPDGVMTVGHHKVWAGDGTGSVKVIDLFSQQLTHTIATGGTNRADEMCLDPRHHLVMVANNADSPPFASLISTTTYSVVKKIPFDRTNGAPNSNNGAEQCQ